VGYTVIEKYQALNSAPLQRNEEEKVVRTARAIRSLNPNATLFLYWAIDLLRAPWYDFAINFDKSPALEVRNADGTLCTHISTDHGGPYPFHVPDYGQQSAINTFVNGVVEMMSIKDANGMPLFDGLWMDGYRDPGSQWPHTLIPNASSATQSAWMKGVSTVGPALASAFPSSIRLINGGSDPVNTWSGYNGVCIEFFSPSDSNIAYLQRVSGKYFVEAHNYNFGGSIATFNATIAAYLIGVNEGSYLGMGAAWDTCEDMLQWLERDEWNKPLGAPDGPASRSLVSTGGSIWTRTFGGNRTRVRINTGNLATCIVWADNSTTGCEV
jgi:hypothetical protein